MRWLAIVCAAALTCLPLAKLYLPDGRGQTLAYLVLTITLSLFVNALLRKQEARLQERFLADSPHDWSVIVNGVASGRLTDAQLAHMRWTVLRDGNVAFAQLANVLLVGVNLVGRILICLPLALMSGLLILVFYMPEDLQETIAALQTATAPELMVVLKGLLILGLSLSCATIMASVWIRNDVGYRDRYHEALMERVRRHCHVAAVGQLYLIPTDFYRGRP